MNLLLCREPGSSTVRSAGSSGALIPQGFTTTFLLISFFLIIMGVRFLAPAYPNRLQQPRTTTRKGVDPRPERTGERTVLSAEDAPCRLENPAAGSGALASRRRVVVSQAVVPVPRCPVVAVSVEVTGVLRHKVAVVSAAAI